MAITKRIDQWRLEVLIDEGLVRLHAAVIVEEDGVELVKKILEPKVVPLSQVKTQVTALVTAVKNAA